MKSDKQEGSFAARYLGFESWQKYLMFFCVLYLVGFYLAPTAESHLRWFYYSIVVIAVPMLIFQGGRIVNEDQNGYFKRIFFVVTLFFLPYLWTPDDNYIRTVRIGLERWFFVLSFALALLYCCRKEKLVSSYLPGLLIVSAFIAVLAVYYNAWANGRWLNNTGMLVLSGNPNQTGMPLGVAVTISASLSVFSSLWKQRVSWGVLALFFGVGMVLTDARSAMLGVFVSGCVLLTMRSGWKLFLLLPVLVIGGVVAYVTMHYPNPIHFMLTGRLVIWQHIWDVFSQNPIWGQGGQSSWGVVWHPYKLEAHSLYFGIAYYAGIFGLLAFGLLMKYALGRKEQVPLSVWRIYFPILVYGLTVHLFEGIYPVYRPHPFWLFTWFPICVLIFSREHYHEK